MKLGYPFIDIASDFYATIFSFPAPVRVLDIFVFDFDLVLRYTSDGLNWVENVLVPAWSFYSIDFECISFQVRNGVLGSNAPYQIIGYV